MTINYFIFISLLLGSVNFVVGAEVMIIKAQPYEGSNDTRFKYIDELLRQDLNKNHAKYGDYRIERTKIQMNEKRSIAEFKIGKTINLIHASQTSMTALGFTDPILVPINKGLLGYRIFFIHKDDIERFKNIKTLKQLKKLVVGQGDGWGDVTVFKHNNISVQTSSKYENLFLMLANRRFDYFSRGIGEIFTEYEQRKKIIPNLRIEESILLVYPHPVFFYVHKDYPEIRKRVSEGLHEMIADGSFDKIFLKHFQKMIEKAKLKNRKVFRLDLPNYTPLKDPRLWYDIQSQLK